MPLEPYKRGALWWAKGRVEYLGKPITEYYRCSTGASEAAGAWAWCRDEEERRINDHVLGANRTLTFAEAVMIYPANAATAKYLIPIVTEWGTKLLSSIAPKDVRNLAQKLYPDASTDTWTRQVITPVRTSRGNEMEFSVGDYVEKFTGEARWSGWIVAAYFTRKGKERYVVEVQPQGF